MGSTSRLAGLAGEDSDVVVVYEAVDSRADLFLESVNDGLHDSLHYVGRHGATKKHTVPGHDLSRFRHLEGEVGFEFVIDLKVEEGMVEVQLNGATSGLLHGRDLAWDLKAVHL